MVSLVFIVVIALYVASALGFLTYVLFQRHSQLRFAYQTCWVGLGLHTAGLAIQLVQHGYPFIHSDRDAYNLIGWAVVSLFLALTRTYRFKGAGAFFMPTALILLIISRFGEGTYQFGQGAVASPWVMIHLGLAFLAFASFLVSFVIGIIFIILEARIKAKDLGGLVRKMPPLEVLDHIHYKALGLGLVLLTAAIVAGALLNNDVQGTFITWDAKQIWILFTWFLYAIFLELRKRIGWRGRRGVILSVLGFMIVVLGYFGLQHSAGV